MAHGLSCSMACGIFPDQGSNPCPLLKPVSTALAGGFLTTAPPGKLPQVKFYLGQNEDCSPGDSVSDSSEKLLEEARGGARIFRSFATKGR